MDQSSPSVPVVEPMQPCVTSLAGQPASLWTRTAAAAKGRRGLSRAGEKIVAMAPTVGTSFLLVGITAAQAILLARSLGPAARGEYAAAISYTRILTFIGLLGANFAIVRRAALAEGNLVGISRAAVRLGALTGLGTMVVVSLLSLFALPPGKQHLAWLAVLCASTLPWEHIRLNLMAVDQGSGRFRRFNAGRLVAAAALPLLLAGALVFGRLSVREATLLLIPATLIGLAFRLAWSDDRRPWLAGKPATRVLAREGLPYATSVVASDLFNRFDTLLILWMANLTQQGYYAAAVPAVQLLVVAPEALALFAFNAGVKSKRTHDARRMVWIAAALLAFQVVAAVIYSLILGRLITLVYGAAFQGATRFAMILLPGQLFQGCTLVADGYLRGHGKAGAGIRARAVGAIAMAGCAVFLYKPYGALAVPLAATAGNTVSALWIGAAILRQTGWRPFWAATAPDQTS